MASYGPTSTPTSFPTDAVVAPLLRPADVSSCHMAGRVTAYEEQVREDPLQDDKETSPTEVQGSYGGWLSWIPGRSKRTTEKATRRPHFVSRPYHGRVVIADRGSCVFEQKTVFAEAGGAEALIVINSEVRLSLPSSDKNFV